MRVALDVMGGDNAPHSTIEGAIKILKEKNDIELILVGKKEIIEKELRAHSFTSDRITIENADEVIDMTDDPVTAVKEKKKASMNVALNLVKEGKADASVSAGNTGALITASQLKLKRIKGILRPAIANLVPNKKGHMLVLDLGATSDCKPEFLNQFALMGSKYVEILFGKENPTVGLLNIGEEEGKGNELTRNTYDLLKVNDKINFLGNVESNHIMEGGVDVVVTDGFTGNILLKTAEGVGKFITHTIKEEVMTSLRYKIAALFLKPVFNKLKKKMDASEYGGAIFLGLNGISIKAHGNSDSNGIKNALNVANKFAKINFIEELRHTMGVEE